MARLSEAGQLCPLPGHDRRDERRHACRRHGDRGRGDAGTSGEHLFDILRLDPVAADLYLLVDAAENSSCPSRQRTRSPVRYSLAPGSPESRPPLINLNFVPYPLEYARAELSEDTFREAQMGEFQLNVFATPNRSVFAPLQFRRQAIRQCRRARVPGHTVRGDDPNGAPVTSTTLRD